LGLLLKDRNQRKPQKWEKTPPNFKYLNCWPSDRRYSALSDDNLTRKQRIFLASNCVVLTAVWFSSIQRVDSLLTICAVSRLQWNPVMIQKS
jgi:hypothetical protein